jgi:PAS domain-containing protein
MIDDGIDENTQFSAASTAPSLTLKDTATVPLLRDVFDAMQDGAALYDEDLKLILCNKKYQEYLFPPGFPDLRPGESATDLAKALFDTNFFFRSQKPGCCGYVAERW